MGGECGICGGPHDEADCPRPTAPHTEPEVIGKLRAAVVEAFPKAQIKIDGPTVGAHYLVDIGLGLPGEHVCIEVRTALNPVQFGFSVVDKDTGFGEGADCLFGHIPTMMKYMKRLFPGIS